MNTFRIDGKIIEIFDSEQKSEKFRAREFVLEVVDGKFPQQIKFQLVNDRCDIIDDCELGEEINVSFKLTGRSWNSRYFTNLQVINITNISTGETTESTHQIYDIPATDLPY